VGVVVRDDRDALSAAAFQKFSARIVYF